MKRFRTAWAISVVKYGKYDSLLKRGKIELAFDIFHFGVEFIDPPTLERRELLDDRVLSFDRRIADSNRIPMTRNEKACEIDRTERDGMRRIR